MFLWCARRVKDGKAHEYWILVENRRLADGRVVRRQVALFSSGPMPCDDVNAIGGVPEGAARGAATAMEGVLAGIDVVAATRTRQLLAPATAPVARRHAVAEGAQDAGGLSAHRSGFGVEPVPALVRQERDGRFAGGGFRRRHAVYAGVCGAQPGRLTWYRVERPAPIC
jgi:hypothetical protein